MARTFVITYFFSEGACRSVLLPLEFFQAFSKVSENEYGHRYNPWTRAVVVLTDDGYHFAVPAISDEGEHCTIRCRYRTESKMNPNLAKWLSKFRGKPYTLTGGLTVDNLIQACASGEELKAREATFDDFEDSLELLWRFNQEQNAWEKLKIHTRACIWANLEDDEEWEGLTTFDTEGVPPDEDPFEDWAKKLN